MSSRDRDPAGRPRNARPRDGLGRPLPHGAHGVDRVPEDVVLSPDEAVRQAQQLIDDGYPFHAHEVFEGVWKSTRGEHRALWQGLAQLAVGLTHIRRGNPKGATALLRRSADRLDPYTAAPPHGLDVASLAAHARSLVDRIERDGLDALSPADLRPRLVVDGKPIPPEEQQLTGGFLTGSVTRNGDTVRRRAGPWSPAVHAWLGHLDERGIDVAPRPLRLDFAAGVEVVSYLGGMVPSGGASPSYLWGNDTLETVAQLIRRFHDASADFTAPPKASWQTVGAYPGGGEVICHNDLAPWNTVFVGERPVGFIDWDLAAPGPRLWDVAFALWHFVPLYGDPASDPFDVAVFEPRARRARLFCDVYGVIDRCGVIDMVQRRQLAAHTAVEQGAQAGDPAYQRLWELGAGDGIRQQINYVQQHRHELEQALI